MTIPNKHFYFIRHGETDWNKRRIIMGSQDIELNSHGILQAQQAKYSIQDIEISNIYSSSLKRASLTADILNEELGLPITYSALLKERSWGISEGDHVDKFKELFSRPIHAIEDHEIPQNAERWEDLKNRIITVITQILTESQGTPLIVAHNGFFSGLVSILELSPIHFKNCELYLCEPSSRMEGKWNIANL